MVSVARTLLRALAPGKVWSMGLCRLPKSSFEFQQLPPPFKLFNSRELRFNRSAPYTQADPFLTVWESRLYLFYEKVVPGGHGKIACKSTTNLSDFTDHGVVLEELHHLSFPFIFEEAGRLFMIPEASRSGEIPLYEFERVPDRLIKRRVLLKGSYVDSSVIRHDGMWYLFTTNNDGKLELFVSESVLEGVFRPHPCSPIATDLRYSRSGGGPIVVGGKLLRIAQDCSVDYGSNISFHEVTELLPSSYQEQLLMENYFVRDLPFNSKGGHHFSITDFKGETIIAIDGKHDDHLLNRLLLRLV